MENIKLCPPAVQHVRRIITLFQEDPDVKVTEVWSGEKVKTIQLTVKGEAKAEALGTLLNGEKVFGNETVRIEVKSSNGKQNNADLFRVAFSGNAAVLNICESDGPLRGVHVMFRPKVVQYVNDDIGDLNGLRSTLYQELAEEVFGDDHYGVFFNTAPANPILAMNDDDFFLICDDDDDDGGYDE